MTTVNLQSKGKNAVFLKIKPHNSRENKTFLQSSSVVVFSILFYCRDQRRDALERFYKLFYYV